MRTDPRLEGLHRKPWRPHGLGLYLLIALAIQALWVIYFLAKHKAFAFVDIGSDTFFCFYPLQVAVGQQFRELHDLTWSFNLGLGGYLGTLFDPFWLLTFPFPDSWQLSLRLPLYLVKLLLGGGFFYGYLRLIGFKERLAVFGALGYAFSSYGVINAQWDLLHGVELVQFSAYLFLLEKYLRQRSPWAAVCAGIAIGMGHPLGLYMFALLSVVYLPMRLVIVERGRWSAYLWKIIGFCLLFVVGLLLTAPLLLPNLYYFLENPRISGSYSAVSTLLSSIFALNDRATIASEVAGFLNKDLLGTGSDYRGWLNYLEGPGFYVGLLLAILIPQLLGPTASRKERWASVIAGVAILLYLVWPAMRYAVYGFGHIAFRFSTLWVSALLLILGLAGLRRAIASGPWWPGIFAGVAGILAIAFGSVVLIPEITNFSQVLRVLGFTMIYATMLLTLGSLVDRRKMMCPLLAIFAVELMLFSVPAITERQVANADGTSIVGGYADTSNLAIKFVEQHAGEEDFYRVEKLFDSAFLNDALVQDYRGTESYYFQPASAIRFSEGTGLAKRPDSAHFIKRPSLARRDMADLLGIRYVLAKDHEPAAYRDMRLLGTAGGINIYRNDSAHSLGHLYGDVVSETEANALSITRRDKLLLTRVVVSDPSVVRNALTRMQTSAPPSPTMEKRTRFRMLRDDRIHGTVQSPTPQLLLLSILYDPNWHATLNGSELALFRADYGLTAALVPAGSHSLEMRYNVPGRRLGWGLAVIAIALLLIGVAWSRRGGSGSPSARA